MKRLVFLSCAFFLSGCQVYPYVEIGAGYKSERSTSVVLRPGCGSVLVSDFGNRGESSCGGRNPTAHINLGLEFNSDSWWKPDRCELSHWSHYRDGTVNGRRETHKDEIVCVVLDLSMPRMGGEETLITMREIRADVPVLLSSGFSEEQLKKRVEGLGFAGFLKKPVGNAELLEKVHSILKHVDRA